SEHPSVGVTHSGATGAPMAPVPEGIVAGRPPDPWFTVEPSVETSSSLARSIPRIALHAESANTPVTPSRAVFVIRTAPRAPSCFDRVRREPRLSGNG